MDEASLPLPQTYTLTMLEAIGTLKSIIIELIEISLTCNDVEIPQKADLNNSKKTTLKQFYTEVKWLGILVFNDPGVLRLRILKMC